MQDTLSQLQQLLVEGQVKRAEVLLARMLRTAEPSQTIYAELLALRARLHIMVGRPQNALEDLATLEKYAQDDVELLQLRADAHFARYEQATVGFAQKADLEQARQLYARILEDDPQNSDIGWVQYQLGRLTLIDDDVLGAIRYFEQALASEESPQHPELNALCYERLGFIAYYELRKLPQALGYLEQAMNEYPPEEPRGWLIQVYLMRARILREQDLTAAYTAASEALQIASNETSKSRSAVIEALFAIAEILAEMPGREQELIATIKRFIQMDKAPIGVDVTWSRVYEMLGNAYMALLEYTQAIPAYQEALRFNPYHPWGETLQYRIAVAQYQLGQYAETTTFLKQLLEQGVETETYRIYALLGNAQFAMGAFAEAQQSYELALQNAPTGIDTSTIQAYHEASSRLAVPL